MMQRMLGVHTIDVVALILFCVTVSLLNLVFLQRIHLRVKTKSRWLRRPDVIVLALLVAGLLVVLFGVK